MPSVAHSYDYLLGGKDNLAVARPAVQMLLQVGLLGGKDNLAVARPAVQMLLQVVPDTPITARVNRVFGKRAAVDRRDWEAVAQ